MMWRVYVNACSTWKHAANSLRLSFLCHQRIFNLSSPVLKSIQDGYLFFSEWYDELTDKG